MNSVVMFMTSQLQSQMLAGTAPSIKRSQLVTSSDTEVIRKNGVPDNQTLNRQHLSYTVSSSCNAWYSLSTTNKNAMFSLMIFLEITLIMKIIRCVKMPLKQIARHVLF